MTIYHNKIHHNFEKIRYSQVSVGSKSTITQRGTWFPAPVSEKNLGFPSTHSTNVIQSAHERNRKKNVYSTCQNQNGVFAKLLVANTRHKRQRSVSYIGNTLWDVELVISVATSTPCSLQKNWPLGQLLSHCMRATC